MNDHFSLGDHSGGGSTALRLYALEICMTLVAAECKDTDVRSHNPFDKGIRLEGSRRPNPDGVRTQVVVPFFGCQHFRTEVFGSKELATFSDPVAHEAQRSRHQRELQT